ncbi:uncharacterized protein G2W53_037923 [Senna tora]|uniref:Uncharacterized protein n=1 Tax=Senna tora TaxID=362788 RepID=A0A834W1G7_9FABA|nr:uncharacterized protein G2W53_037923 [Senna tora]
MALMLDNDTTSASSYDAVFTCSHPPSRRTLDNTCPCLLPAFVLPQ